ncbi:MAG: hypothetical protein ACFFBI_02855 [Promethearchaeota archaeon]
MSRFFDNIADRVKKIPSFFAKRLVKVSISGDKLEITFPPLVQSSTVREFLEDLLIRIDTVSVYDAQTYPFDFNVKLNEIVYTNQDLLGIYDKTLRMGDKIGIIVPNRASISVGFHRIAIGTHSEGIKIKFSKYMGHAPPVIKTEKYVPQIVENPTTRQCDYCGKEASDPDQIICEYCGSELK